MSINHRPVAEGHGGSDVSAMRDLLHTIAGMPEVSDDVLGAVCSSFQAALQNRGRRPA
jgi:hypothetical protein